MRSDHDSYAAKGIPIISNLDHFPVRDNKGPRKGKGQTGTIHIGG